MCTLHGTRYSQCGDHVLINTIHHCRRVDKSTWTCPAGTEYKVSVSERFCPKCHRSLNDSVCNLFHKMEYYSVENYTPTPGSTGVSGTPESDGARTPEEMEI